MKMILIFLIMPVILDMLLGDPVSFPHPIIYIGKVISKYEKWIRKSRINLKVGGFLLLILTIITVLGVMSLVLFLLSKVSVLMSVIASVYLLYASLASKCLDLEARKVYSSLIDEDIKKSRLKLSYLVGRDTTNLTKEEVIKGTVETIAENTIDGILAPLMFIIVGLYFGYPVQFVFFYKTINTLDSMVGYQNKKYKDLGYASAKLDDIVNLVPARVGSVFMLVGGKFLKNDFSNGFKILKRDRRNHKSPNCAYPEASVAGLLNIRLGGTHTYFGEEVYKPTIGDENKQAEPRDITDTIKIMYASEIIMLIISILILIFLI